VKYFVLVATLVSAVLVGGPLPSASAAATTTVTVTNDAHLRIVGHFGTTAAGGFFSLYTYGGSQQNSLVDLVSGNANSLGDVDVTITSAAAQAATTSNQFELAMASLLQGSTTRAYVGVIGIGLQADDLAAGVKVEWGSIPLDLVTVYPNPQDAINAIGGGGMGSFSPTSASSGDPDCPECVYIASGDNLSTIGPNDPTQDLHGYDMPGRRAFRGYSHRSLGAKSQFKMVSADTQQWQNGYRVQAGPFTAQSQTERALGSSQETNWPIRSDCWSPAFPNDGPNCTSTGQEGNADGRQKKYGNDTWRWAQGIHSSCLPIPLLPCLVAYWTNESLWNKQYDGGTDSQCQPTCTPDRTNYNKKPSEVTTNLWGSWASYTPGASAGLYRTKDNSFSDGVTISVNFPESYGSASFTSSEKHTKSSKWGDFVWFRPTTDYAHFYKWYRYSLVANNGWANEAWSCEYDTNWGGSNPGPPSRCWNLGS
jgi:hypothetical protein